MRWNLFPGVAVLIVLGLQCSPTVNNNSVSLLVTVRASLGDSNQQGTGDASLEHQGVSADGRYIVFASKATNLVPGDTNQFADIFLRDMVARTTILISVNSAGTGPGNGPSAFSSISADGRYVAFHSDASDLHADDPDTLTDIFVRDVQTGQTVLVSRASGPLGVKGNNISARADISADGRYVAFHSQANNLDINDGDTSDDIYRRDIQDPTNPTLLISVDSAGTKASGSSQRPRLSADGRFVAFESTASNLVLSDTNVKKDCFLRDVLTGTTSRISLTATAGEANGDSDHAVISGDGSMLVFRSSSSNILPEDDGFESDIFVRELLTGLTTIASAHSSGSQAGNNCNHPSISGNGKFVVFQSTSSSLVNGDTNGKSDCFIHEIATGQTTRLSVATFGGELNGDSERPFISADGRYVSFYSTATNIADDDTNGSADIFLRGPPR